MNTPSANFALGIDDLKSYLRNAELEISFVSKLSRGALNNHLTGNEIATIAALNASATQKRQQLYAAGIVGLYGLVERYVYAAIVAHLEILRSSVEFFNDLPDEVRKNHSPLSVELLRSVGEERFSSALSFERIVANLHSCVAGSDDFVLNHEAFVNHRGNLRISKMRELLAAIGVRLLPRRVFGMPALQRYCAELDPPVNVLTASESNLATLLGRIDDIVERRNLISHGVIDEIEGADLITGRCDFATAFVGAIDQLMTGQIIAFQIAMGRALALGKPIIVHHDKIVCFEAQSGVVTLSDTLVAIADELPWRWGKIESIEVDHVRQEALDIRQKLQFGVKVDFSASPKHVYYVLKG